MYHCLSQKFKEIFFFIYANINVTGGVKVVEICKETLFLACSINWKSNLGILSLNQKLSNIGYNMIQYENITKFVLELRKLFLRRKT